MAGNTKYTTVENIIGRLGTKLKGSEFDSDEIAQWCAECTIEVIGNPLGMHQYNMIELVVKQQKALLPCNIYRLQDILYSADSRLTGYYNDGTHLIFNSSQNFATNEKGQDVVYINFLGIAVDLNTGYPLILRGHELACEAYCYKQLYREDFYKGKITQSVWREISDECSIQCAAANNGIRHESNDDMKRILDIVHNIIPRHEEIPMMHLKSVE